MTFQNKDLGGFRELNHNEIETVSGGENIIIVNGGISQGTFQGLGINSASFNGNVYSGIAQIGHIPGDFSFMEDILLEAINLDDLGLSDVVQEAIIEQAEREEGNGMPNEAADANMLAAESAIGTLEEILEQNPDATYEAPDGTSKPLSDLISGLGKFIAALDAGLLLNDLATGDADFHDAIAFTFGVTVAAAATAAEAPAAAAAALGFGAEYIAGNLTDWVIELKANGTLDPATHLAPLATSYLGTFSDAPQPGGNQFHYFNGLFGNGYNGLQSDGTYPWDEIAN